MFVSLTIQASIWDGIIFQVWKINSLFEQEQLFYNWLP